MSTNHSDENKESRAHVCRPDCYHVPLQKERIPAPTDIVEENVRLAEERGIGGANLEWFRTALTEADQAGYARAMGEMESKLHEIEKGAIKMLGAVILGYGSDGEAILPIEWELNEGKLERETLSDGSTLLRAVLTPTDNNKEKI